MDTGVDPVPEESATGEENVSLFVLVIGAECVCTTVVPFSVQMLVNIVKLVPLVVIHAEDVLRLTEPVSVGPTTT